MELDQLIQALTIQRGLFPRGPIREAIARQEEITPGLLEMIEAAKQHFERDSFPGGYLAHMVAPYLLAQFREPRAYRPLIDLFSCLSDQEIDYFSDFVTEDLGRTLASVYDGDLGPLKALIENPEAHDYVRGAAQEALTVLVAQGVLAREDVMAYVVALLQGPLGHTPSGVLNHLLTLACDLFPEEALGEINRAFDEDLVDEGYVDRGWVEKVISLGREKVLGELVESPRRRYIEDALADLVSWEWDFWPPDSNLRKLGRNQPCPCGSGRKFKHCCLPR